MAKDLGRLGIHLSLGPILEASPRELKTRLHKEVL